MFVFSKGYVCQYVNSWKFVNYAGKLESWFLQFASTVIFIFFCKDFCSVYCPLTGGCSWVSKWYNKPILIIVLYLIREYWYALKFHGKCCYNIRNIFFQLSDHLHCSSTWNKKWHLLFRIYSPFRKPNLAVTFFVWNTSLLHLWPEVFEIMDQYATGFKIYGSHTLSNKAVVMKQHTEAKICWRETNRCRN